MDGRSGFSWAARSHMMHLELKNFRFQLFIFYEMRIELPNKFWFQNYTFIINLFRWKRFLRNIWSPSSSSSFKYNSFYASIKHDYWNNFTLIIDFCPPLCLICTTQYFLDFPFLLLSDCKAAAWIHNRWVLGVTLQVDRNRRKNPNCNPRPQTGGSLPSNHHP